MFRSGYENCTGSPADAHTDITGTDEALGAQSDWAGALEQHPRIGEFFLFYEGGGPAQRYARIVGDPTQPENRVLHFWLQEAYAPYDDGSKKKGRIQATLGGNDDLREFTIRQRLYVHPDLEALRSAPRFSWLTIQEFWNNLPDQAHPFRISIDLQKPSDADGELRLGVHGQVKNTSWDNVWETVNTSHAVPIGQWMLFETYVREGNGQTGRFRLRVTDQAGTTTTVVDVTDFTHHPDDPAPDGFGNFNVMKLYAPDRITDPMRDAGLALQLYWDDLEVWEGGAP